VDNFPGEYWGGILHTIHEGYVVTGDSVGLVLGVGLLFLILSGAIISVHISIRQNETQ